MSFQDFIIEQEVRKKEEENERIMGTIIEFFSTHTDLDDADIQELAKSLGIESEEVRNRVYILLTDLLNAGKFKENPIEPDKEELEKGIDYELETHTKSKAIARKLALDNLVNDEKFYTKLEKREK